MNLKKILLATTVIGTALGSAVGGKKGLKKGLGLGMKLGAGATVATAVLGNRLYKKGKAKLKKKIV